MGKIKMRKALIAFALSCALLGCDRSAVPAVQVKITQDELDRPRELYSFYIGTDGKEVLHGECLEWDYKQGSLMRTVYINGEIDLFEAKQIPGWTPEKGFADPKR
jgi:hypothetical protein